MIRRVYVDMTVTTVESICLDEDDFEEAYELCKDMTNSEKNLEWLMYEHLTDLLYDRVDYDAEPDNRDLDYLEEQIKDFLLEKEYHMDETGQCHLFELED